ncbi:Phylloplanin [Forsythia ovata]|uniref:Phylloplanin n=1 Tax=Forsythia ovata TaxID=205694 RepID=A0ABD1PJR3_9LAMI
MHSNCTNVNLNTFSTDATVHLRCLGQNVLASTTTNSTGGFTLNLNASPIQLPIIPTCQVVVVTPLTRCNATLPGIGRLVSTGLILVRFNVNGTTLNIELRVLGFNINTSLTSLVNN